MSLCICDNGHFSSEKMLRPSANEMMKNVQRRPSPGRRRGSDDDDSFGDYLAMGDRWRKWHGVSYVASSRAIAHRVSMKPSPSTTHRSVVLTLYRVIVVDSGGSDMSMLVVIAVLTRKSSCWKM